MFSHDPLFGEELSTTQIQESERRNTQGGADHRTSRVRLFIADFGTRWVASALLMMIAGIVLVLAAVIPAKAAVCGHVSATVWSCGFGKVGSTAPIAALFERHAHTNGKSWHGRSMHSAQPVAVATVLIRLFG